MPSPVWDRKHLLGLEGLTASDIFELLDMADGFREAAAGRAPRLNLLANRTIANLFFEDSTRTRSSFTMAARRLGADTLELSNVGSSVSKGETIIDSALNIQAMGVDAFIVRSSASGAAAMIARAVRPGVAVINAGDGRHEHPTQGLLDLLTLRQRFGDLRGRTVAIVGDIVSSRVARSALHGLTTCGANVILIGPPPLVPRSFETIAMGPGKVQVRHDLDQVLSDGRLDAIMMLRVQFERQERPETQTVKPPSPQRSGGEASGPSPISSDYRQLYGLNAARAAQLPEHAVVMHPGPMNRGLEIDSDVADDPRRSVILQQVSNGVAARMAVLARLIRE